MDNSAEVREFLTTRRARITPDVAGLPSFGSRRVPGLRRSEVATLAGMSVEYYARLERGQIGGASSSVLEALARALLRWDAGRFRLQPLAVETTVRKKPVAVHAGAWAGGTTDKAGIKAEKAATTAVTVLRERAGKLLRK